MSERVEIMGQDVEAEEWAAWSPPVVDKLRDWGAVACLRHKAGPTSEETLRALSATDCAKLATFLLAAAGPDAVREALVKLAPWPFEGETPLETTARLMREWLAMKARAERAEKRLAAVLALTKEDMAEALCPGVPNACDVGCCFEDEGARALNLIRSRATEGAEAPTGAAI